MRDSTPMNELLAYASWQSATWLGIAGLFSLIGTMLALRLMPVSSRASALQTAGCVTPGLWRCSLVFAVTGWGVFLACFKAFHPHLEQGLPLGSLLQSWIVQAAAATLSTVMSPGAPAI